MSHDLSQLGSVVERVLGQSPEDVTTYTAAANGEVRWTCKFRVEGRSHFATHRQTPSVAEKEARALQVLTAGGAPALRFLSFEPGWLIQESVGEPRLSW